MEFIPQTLQELLATLRPLVVEWQDDRARRVIAEIEALPVKSSYTVSDLKRFLDLNFDDGLLICRLFLGLSKDQFTAALRNASKDGRTGVTAYRKGPDAFLETLVALGILEAMGEQTNRTPKWSDVLIERLRSGRGSAISGQRRGRSVEDFVEQIVSKVFGDGYAVRCTFIGQRNKTAKCDIAIPSKGAPRILIEAKGYGATGSKMTDVIGDIEKIIAAKRSDTNFLFFTDGLTWKGPKERLSEDCRVSERRRHYTYLHACAGGSFRSGLAAVKA